MARAISRLTPKELSQFRSFAQRALEQNQLGRTDLWRSAPVGERKGLERCLRDVLAPSTKGIAPRRCLRILDAFDGRLKNTPGYAAWLKDSKRWHELLFQRYLNTRPEGTAALASIRAVKTKLGLEAASAMQRVAPDGPATLASVLIDLLIKAGCMSSGKRKPARDIVTSYLATPVR